MMTPASSDARRNYLLNIGEGVFFLMGASFISFQTVLPALVARLGGGSVAVGAIGVIAWVGIFLPQVLAARFSRTLQWKKPWAIGFGLSQRIMLLILGFGLFFVEEIPPDISLTLFFVVFTANQVLLGITTPGWFDLFGKLIPVTRRGRISGIRNSIAGAGGVVCGIILTWLLTNFSFPDGYALAILLAAALQLASIGLQVLMVEREPSPVVERKSIAVYARELLTVLRTNVPFRKFLIASAFLILASVPASFFTVYALQEFRATEASVGTFTLVMVAVQVLSAAACGYIADRYGNKAALGISSAAMLLANSWAFIAPGLDSFYTVFAFVGIFLGTDLMARYNISIEYGPVEDRSTYVALMNTILAPTYVFGILAGWMAETSGYSVLFVLGIVCSLIGLALLVFIVRDPRHTNPGEARFLGNI